MKTKVKNPASLIRSERLALSMEVLDLLDGLSVAEVHLVLKEAGALMNNYTRHDVITPWFQQAVAELSQLDD